MPPKGIRPKNYRHGHGHKAGQGTKGGKSSTEYVSWSSMRARCTNPNNKDYAGYGGIGISVCERWLSFENFLEDMGVKPRPGLQLERRDNSRGYHPDNCYWATAQEQANNRRSNVWHSYNGKTLTLAQWAKELGIRACTLSRRLNVSGWSFEKSATTPVGAIMGPRRKTPDLGA